jgi:chemotaxis protein CheX
MNVEFINPFISAFKNVLLTMAQLDLAAGAPKKKTTELAQGDVTGLLGMTGPQTKGSFSITFDEALALEIMSRMLGEKPASIDAEVIDLVGELTNMVAGGAKNTLGEKGYDFGMATPVVVSGKDHTVTHRVDGPKLILPFKTDVGKAHIEICFEKA